MNSPSSLLLLVALLSGFANLRCGPQPPPACTASDPSVCGDEDLFGHIERRRGGFDQELYRALAGAASSLREGDASLNLAADDDSARSNARTLIERTTLEALRSHPLLGDPLAVRVSATVDASAEAAILPWTVAELRTHLLASSTQLQALLPALSSQTLAFLVKVMTDDELASVAARLATSTAPLGAVLQVTSPTDEPDDLRWQVFAAWSRGIGDVGIAVRPKSRDAATSALLGGVLQELVSTFGLADSLPSWVESPLQEQLDQEEAAAGSTMLWHAAVRGNAAANLPLATLEAAADLRSGPFHFALETAQGAEALAGAAEGVDMVVNHAFAFGLARLLQERLAAARGAGWIVVTDATGDNLPAAVATREQWARSSLEAIALAKLHGLTVGVDIGSSTLSAADLEWTRLRVLAAGPAYLRVTAGPTDYATGRRTTTGDALLRHHLALKATGTSPLLAFFQQLGVFDQNGVPTAQYGDPARVYVAYRRQKGDMRADEELLTEGRAQWNAVLQRGVLLSEGGGG